jgi:hypothetical protein
LLLSLLLSPFPLSSPFSALPLLMVLPLQLICDRYGSSDGFKFVQLTQQYRSLNTHFSSVIYISIMVSLLISFSTLSTVSFDFFKNELYNSSSSIFPSAQIRTWSGESGQRFLFKNYKFRIHIDKYAHVLYPAK